MNINDYISELCMKYGTYIYNSINIIDYISILGARYGSYIFHPVEDIKYEWRRKESNRDILNYLNDTELNNYEIVMAFRKMMKELLEEDGDHIPRID